MRVPLRFLLVAGVATALLVVGGVLLLGGDDGDDPAPAPEPFRTTPLAEVDTTTAAVTRGPFCDRVDDRQVAAALGLEPDATVPDALVWANGDELDLGSGRPDVVHEFGCAYAVQDGGEARAWVFAPPVDATRAAQLAEAAGRAARLHRRHRPGVRRPDAGADLHRRRRHRAGVVPRAVRRRVAGLRGRGPASGDPVAADVADRAGRWCAGVLEATATD